MLISILILAIALSAWLLWANGAVMTARIRVEDAALPEEFSGFKIAQVSDLHNAEFGDGNAKLLSLLAAAEPDIIAVTGDLIDSRHTDVEAALAFISRAAEIAPVYYVTGNHEARLGFERLVPRITEAGAVPLRSEAVYIERGGARICLAGIDDPAFASGGDAASRAGAMLDGLIVPGVYTVLLAHRPELAEVYARAGANLTLSGHAHGGQIRLPFLGGLFAPGQGFLPEYASGLYEAGGMALVVSRGLGASLFPLRVNNRPELVIVELGRPGK